jgi:23S rRNA maturation mini-RNase III
MHDHKVIQVLRSFENHEIRKLKKFLNSEYPGFPRKVILLGSYILNCYPDFSEESLSEHRLLDILNIKANEANAHHELIRCLSGLLAAIEQFVAVESLDARSYIKDSFIAEFYYQIQNKPGLSKAIKQNQKAFEKTSTKESANFLYAYINQKLAHNYEKQMKRFDHALAHLQKANIQLDTYYMIQLFQSGIGYIQSARSKPPEADYPLLESAKNYISAHESSLEPLLVLWKLAYELTENPHAKKTYERLKGMLLKHLQQILPMDANAFVAILNNALTLRFQMDEGRKQYIEEKFNLYEIEMREGWLIANGIMNFKTFNNIVVASLALKKNEFAENFIERYSDFLLPEHRESVTNVSFG